MKKENKALRRLAKEALTSNDVCEDWKNKILDVAPSLKHKQKLNGWFKDSKHSQWLFYKENEYIKYGFDTDGNYDIVGLENSKSDYEFEYEATEQEVFEALKNEAVRLGFKEGVYYDASKLGYEEQKINLIKGDYFEFKNNILTIDNWEIFKNGVWAEIIETITKEEAEKQLCKIII